METTSDNSLDRKSKLLVHQVFTSEIGESLLDDWMKTYVESKTFRADPVEMAARAANKDFVTHIKSIIREVSTWKS